MLTPGCRWQSSPISTPGPIVQCAPIFAIDPITTFAEITTKGPIVASSPIFANGSISALGWTPRSGKAVSSRNPVRAAMATRGRSTRIAASSPKLCQSVSCQRMAARASPFPRSSANFASIATANWSQSAFFGSLTPRTLISTIPTARADKASAISLILYPAMALSALSGASHPIQKET